MRSYQKQKPKVDPLRIPEMIVSGKKKDHPSINDYYKAMSVGKKPIQYQHGLSNYSSVQLGDDRVSFKKSLSQDVYRLDTERAEKMINSMCPHIKKTFEQRKQDYGEANGIVGVGKILEMEQMMRDKLQQRTKTGPFQLRKTFKYFDRDGSGGIDFSEFQRAMELMGFQFTEVQQLALFAGYDESCSGEVNYNEFVEKLMESDFHGVAHSGHKSNLTRMATSAFRLENGEDELGSMDEDSDLEEEERERFRRSEIRILFDQIDIDSSGSIDMDEAALLLKQLNLKADHRQIEEGFIYLDKDKSGRIEYEEFYDWYVKTCFT